MRSICALILGSLVLLAVVSLPVRSDDPFEAMRKRMDQMKLNTSGDSGLKPLPDTAQKQQPAGDAAAPAKKVKAVSAPEELPGMVYIPEGEFTMGTNKGFDFEYPEHTVFLKGYYIDRYEVTNAQYKRFVDYTGHPAPRNWKKGQMPRGRASACPPRRNGKRPPVPPTAASIPGATRG